MERIFVPDHISKRGTHFVYSYTLIIIAFQRGNNLQETTVSRYLWSILYYTNALGSVTKRPTIPESIEDL